MKTAEEWYREFPSTFYLAREQSLVEQIQLDAMKEGMRRAAGEAEYYTENGHHGNDMMTCQNIHQAILTAAEQLTIENL